MRFVKKYSEELIDAALELYSQGASLLSLCSRFGISRPALTNRFRERGVKIIGIRERNLQRYVGSTPEARKADIAPAQAARRGMKDVHSTLCARAATREARGHGISEFERNFATLLSARGIKGLLQHAVGPFNIDIGIREQLLAVEIFGGGFHSAGRHRRRTERRYRYLAEQGWKFIIVWVFSEHLDELAKAADTIVDIAGSEIDAHAGSWWTIRGDGVRISSGRGDYEKIATLVSRAKIPR